MYNITNPPLWVYFMCVGFILLGIILLKMWRRSINPIASEWDRMLSERTYFIQGIGSIAIGIIGLIIAIYKACNN